MAIINGTQNDDTLQGTELPDQMNGLDGFDTLYGRGGADVLRGAADSDRVYGGDGDDKLYGAIGGGFALDGPDNDYLDGGNGNDVMAGQFGSDTMFGRSGNDRMYGGGGGDTMFGGVGDDVLSSGGGLDIMTGNAGKDLFRFDFNTGDLPDSTLYVDYVGATVTDFVSGTDRLLVTSTFTQVQQDPPFQTEVTTDMLTFLDLDTDGNNIIDGLDEYTDLVEGSLVIDLDAASATATVESSYGGTIELQDVTSLTRADVVG